MNARKTPITHDDLQRAIRKFVKNGGMIHKLPPQVAPSRLPVGGQWAAFEPMPILADVLEGQSP